MAGGSGGQDGSVTSTLVTPKDENKASWEGDKVQMKKQLGLLEGVAIILGIIFGSGIFMTPGGVIKGAGSVGFSLAVWAMCGLMSMVGALCYAELGTSIPKSGGDYAYLFEIFGPLPAFLYLWDAMLVFVPTTNAIMGLTFARYVIQPFFPECHAPDAAIRMVAATTICFLTWINCHGVKSTTKLQNVFMFAKIGALVIIIVAGLIYLMLPGGTSNFDNMFDGTSTSVSKVSVAFYSGIFSYSGWNYLNFMTEELVNPYVNLPRAIYISLPVVTLAYVLANVAYLAVLTTSEALSSNAIAFSFAERALGPVSGVMPFLVALSAFGGLSVHIMTSSRMCFVGARYGHFPALLSHINIQRYTPVPSLVFLCILSLIMLCSSDVNMLITYSTFVESFFIMLSVSGVLWLRYKQPNLERPIKVTIWIPIFFVLVCLFLLIVPVFEAPWEVLVGCLITITGIPVYFIFIAQERKPEVFNNAMVSVTHFVQKLFLSAKEDKGED
ncbi:Y+L amino acid transporter 2-like [Frankliniella occidentalis]|uniref:Y+L amino acid transporter 2 n=2 Tax=Frankliniella occidentalis TaxID=133901 RepID=A0A9C6X1U7_FRAOC|nr:Y+L amino acid transporter 2 [Frankliniella occidentalis]KAE8742385.1 Y+L amino acid transporter 2-like [Frankliniella occidentalis]